MALRLRSEKLESSGAYRGDAEFVPYNGCDRGAEDLYGVQHFLVRKRRDAHLECDAGDTAENFIHVKDLFRDRFSVANQQRTGRSAQGVELSACGGWPAAFLSDFGKRVRIARKEYISGFFRGAREKSDGVKTYSKSLGGMTRAAPGLAVKVYEWAEAFGLTADYGHHKRKSEHTRTNEGFGGAADPDPDRQRILQRAWVDCLAGKSRAVFTGPVHLRACADFQEKIEFLRKERVVVFKAQSEERIGLNERTATGNNFGAAPRDEVESRELLKNANGVGCAENRDCAGKADIFRARGGSGENHNGSGVEEFGAVMFANAEDVHADSIGEFNFLQ